MPRQTDLKTIQVVALVLENHQGEVLIQQRKKNTHLAGLWEFPGGKIEPQESQEQALIREIHEEIGFTLNNPQHLITLKHEYPEKTIELIVYHEICDNPQVNNAEHQQLQWIKKTKLSSITMPQANSSIINLL